MNAVQVESVVQQYSIESALPDIKSGSGWSFWYSNTKQSGMVYAVIYWADLISELFRKRTEHYAIKVVKLLNRHNFDVKTFRNMLKNKTSPSRLVWEDYSLNHENEGFL